jgi:phage shock protein PspC (stress-responsive transcriptional regulator)
MQKVITVSLNGNAYQLDEDAYALLSQYLEQSGRALQTNPDRPEIIADLEQAIGEKCARYLGPHKTVVTGPELAQVVAEMGPVDGDPGTTTESPGAANGTSAGAQAGSGGAWSSGAATGSGASPGASSSAGGGAAAGGGPSVSRRLYQISDGAVFSGVCKGLSAYFAVDVTLVRAIFVAAFLLTGGAALIAYVVMMFIIPYASTSEERAAAHGMPFNARVLVERAKEKYAQFASSSDWRDSRNQWRNEWRRARAEWRFERRRMRDEWRRHWRFGVGGAPASAAALSPGAKTPAANYATHIITGTVLAILGLIFAIFTIAWVLALLSLLTTGALLGWSLPHGVPFWAALIVLVLLYNAIAWPIKAMRRSIYYSVGPYQGAWVEAWNGIAALAVVFALLWYGYHHQPEVHNLFDHLSQWWNESVSTQLNQLHLGERHAPEGTQTAFKDLPLL